MPLVPLSGSLVSCHDHWLQRGRPGGGRAKLLIGFEVARGEIFAVSLGKHRNLNLASKSKP